ncbi:MAG: dephospho-CoA kinase [Anaerovibrio sp.]|uniref:dephospho-CoA kinase n=1 Tax=Anaerovibrio sp. TaxID=1872532 RepID=UPI0025D447C4|nr:dephospho-CoA kinase [Anaerovibrio sp.]MCR5177237.1 dephospho-CoA kinase [Anaerovibrio sp.]
MKIIGLTGGIASGKSTVSGIISEAGYTVIDCDRIAWKLSEPDRDIWQLYYKRYGDSVINEDRSLNRQAVAKRVFGNAEELRQINSIVHPIIEREMLAGIKKAEKNGENIIFLDVPLLFEAGFAKMTDEIWLVYVPFEIQLKRLIERNGYDKDEAISRIHSQMDLDKKRALADIIINNDGDIESLRRQVIEKVNNEQG